MDGHLVDEAGYPRNDIDVYAVRIARNQVISKKKRLVRTCHVI